MLDELETIAKSLDVGAVAVVLGVAFGWVPQIAAILTVLWLGVRLYNEVMTAVYRRRRVEKQRRR